MNFSRLFILRPVGTTLMAAGLFLAGIVAYAVLPVASLPAIDFPAIQVSASRPGADPETMASSVAAPLERRLGTIAGVSELTSTSSLGSTRITLVFDMAHKVDSAARDVQAALNAAATDLPGDLPTLPSFRKFNPNSAPIIIYALTSDTMSGSDMYDAADSVLVQRLSQVEGVAEVSVSGSDQPAVRVQTDPQRIANMGLSLEQVRLAIANANARGPIGAFEGSVQSETIGVSDQISDPADYANILIKGKSGVMVRLGDVANVSAGVRNVRSSASFNGKPAVILQITKQADANVLATVDRIKALMPELQKFVPAGLDISVLSDRTLTIRASVREIQKTLIISILLVMLVVMVFMQGTTAILAAGVTVPLALTGTFAAMWLVGFTVDNLSLMAITISVGFVVDDAIVIIENIYRNLEKGLAPLQAALVGARQIGFTVVSISLSLIAAFVPLLFADGVVGKILREFSLTLTFAILLSTFVSLSVTPMIVGQLMKAGALHSAPNRVARSVDAVMGRLVGVYRGSLLPILHHPWLAGLATALTIALTVYLFVQSPKGLFPQDDTGLMFGSTEASPDISYPAMLVLQKQAAEIVRSDPAVESVASFIGASGPFSGTVNQGRLIISVKLALLKTTPSTDIIARLRPKLAKLNGINTYINPSLDIRVGGRSGKSTYQFTLWDPDITELEATVPRVVEALRKLPGMTDVNTDRDQGGLQANLVIDRAAASRLGVAIGDIDTALNNAYSQRQVSTIYAPRNQYRVIFEVNAPNRDDPNDVANMFVPSKNGGQIPISAVARLERGTVPLAINHQGAFPAITISYALAKDAVFDDVTKQILATVNALHLPDNVHAEFAGDAKDNAANGSNMVILLITALLAVYIILGVLYESLLHPLTILSTLPSAGLGALLALRGAGMELTIVALIGIIMLIGIVKKNGIMLVDFAISAQRERGKTPEEAIFEACLERFRPILMTTLAAMLGAIPLAIATGEGSALRQPLGITIVGGLALSQVLTLYTTPIIYLALAKASLRMKIWRNKDLRPAHSRLSPQQGKAQSR